MEIALRLLITSPRCWTALGSSLGGISVVMFFLGWRLARKSDRAEEVTGGLWVAAI